MLRFVLLEHNWNGVHWDFMLESKQARPCAPGRSTNRSCPAATFRPARWETIAEIYLEYEGEVGGNRGSVRRIDAGTYRVIEWSERARAGGAVRGSTGWRG